MAPIVRGNTSFGFELYSKLKSEKGNLFFSPYSISTCLAMMYSGARGNTKSEMADVLHFPPNQNEVDLAFAQFQSQLNQLTNGIELSVANGLWAQQSHPFLAAYLGVARTQYAAELEQVDFKTEAAQATTRINQWVAEKTRNKIRDILSEGQLNALTRLVLANAIYFKGAWKTTFQKTETVSQPFHVTPQRDVQAPLMHHSDVLAYMEGPDFQAVDLPYVGGQFALLAILPRQVDGLAKLEGMLTETNLTQWLSQMSRKKVELFLPRFKSESRTMELATHLQEMGMHDAFRTAADFSGIDGARDLLISSISHKAFVEVTEEGTEAAAATVATMALASAITKPPPPPPVFRADHPFIFMIRDTRSGSILFLGRLVEPTQ